MPDSSPIDRDAIGAPAPDRLAPIAGVPASAESDSANSDSASAATDPATAGIGQRIQEPYLNNLRKIRRTVVIYLVNGVKLVGKIASFDQHTVALEGHEKQVINKHAIATVMPAPPRPAVRKPRDATIIRRNHLGLPIKPQ